MLVVSEAEGFLDRAVGFVGHEEEVVEPVILLDGGGCGWGEGAQEFGLDGIEFGGGAEEGAADVVGGAIEVLCVRLDK